MPFRIWNRMWPDSLRFSHDLGCVALRITTMSTFGISRERVGGPMPVLTIFLFFARPNTNARGAVSRGFYVVQRNIIF